MATSHVLPADGRTGRSGIPKHLRRRTETLIPVSLRLLDETGRRRIAEPMLGIATEVSGYDMRVSVMGRAGRPLSLRLSTQQKVVMSFLATELHEKVESLVCDLRSVVPVAGQPDAWLIDVRLPGLMPDLTEEILTALHRYGRRAPRAVPMWALFAIVAAGVIGAAWLTSGSSGEPGGPGDAQRRSIEELQSQLAYSNDTVEQLTASLEETDRELEAQREAIREVEQLRAAFETLKRERADLSERLEDAELRRTDLQPIRLPGVTLTDFRALRAMRGAATAPRLTFRDGILELHPPRPERRRITANIGRLLIAYAQLKGRPLRLRGSWALESSDGAVGIETEEAFVVGDETKAKPDFVFESLDPEKSGWLAGYAKIGITELWSWSRGQLRIRRLDEGTYIVVSRSALLPGLDPTLLADFATREDPVAAVDDFIRVVEETSSMQ